MIIHNELGGHKAILAYFKTLSQPFIGNTNNFSHDTHSPGQETHIKSFKYQ
jgi:hypothetical protein